MKAIAVIPARHASTRFPGKMLANRTGKPLIQHVYEQARKARYIGRVVVATDDGHIAEAVTNFGGEFVMTRLDHPNGTSRIAEAIGRLGPPQGGGLAACDSALIVNVQGDEPEIDPELIDLAIATLDHPGHRDAVASTVAAPFGPHEDPGHPNIVKVVIDQRGRALYFSRAAIPYNRDGEVGVPPMKHVGLYVYRREFLLSYPGLAATPLEKAEKLEQLRILEHGHSIAVAVWSRPIDATGIDTPEQYDAFVNRTRTRS